MVFSSVPLYPDPLNWQQQPNRQEGSGNENPQLPPPPPQAGSLGSIRPGSMADRARVAKIPQPETALKCPRCESTNTKFCYFNNYSLTQPRHFCKTCRRYWTRGGALRNVPVGGGCRRNKKSKSSSSKSPASTERHAGSNSTIGLSAEGVEQWRLQQVQQFPFLGSFEPPTGLYPFQNEDLTAVKLLENQGLNLSRQFLDTSENNQYWVGNAWTDFSGLNSSSTSNRL
ncbi:unnamed protein product, partial [Vitis vinifera]